MRKPLATRWSEEAIKSIKATPREPNPRERSPRLAIIEAHAEERKVVVEVGGEGRELPELIAEEKDFRPRDFKITKGILERYGFYEGCPGCMQAMMGERVTGHTPACGRDSRERCRETMKAGKG